MAGDLELRARLPKEIRHYGSVLFLSQNHILRYHHSRFTWKVVNTRECLCGTILCKNPVAVNVYFLNSSGELLMRYQEESNETSSLIQLTIPFHINSGFPVWQRVVYLNGRQTDTTAVERPQLPVDKKLYIQDDVGLLDRLSLEFGIPRV